MKRMRKFVICSGDKFPFNVTIVITTRADGHGKVKPQLIHSGKRMNTNVLDGIDGDWPVHLSPKGFQGKIGFERWAKHFVRIAREGKHEDRKTFLFLDGHNSRWTYEGLTFLADNNVVVICLLSHTSIITQPNDNGINAVFHRHTGDRVQIWRGEHASQQIQKGDANRIITEAWGLYEKEAGTIKKGFDHRTTGICPANRKAMNYADLKISEACTLLNESDEQRERDAKVRNCAVRQKAHEDYIYISSSDMGPTWWLCGKPS
jgi:hypothetical protein